MTDNPRWGKKLHRTVRHILGDRTGQGFHRSLCGEGQMEPVEGEPHEVLRCGSCVRCWEAQQKRKRYEAAAVLDT